MALWEPCNPGSATVWHQVGAYGAYHARGRTLILVVRGNLVQVYLTFYCHGKTRVILRVHGTNGRTCNVCY